MSTTLRLRHPGSLSRALWVARAFGLSALSLGLGGVVAWICSAGGHTQAAALQPGDSLALGVLGVSLLSHLSEHHRTAHVCALTVIAGEVAILARCLFGMPPLFDSLDTLPVLSVPVRTGMFTSTALVLLAASLVCARRGSTQVYGSMLAAALALAAGSVGMIFFGALLGEAAVGAVDAGMSPMAPHIALGLLAAGVGMVAGARFRAGCTQEQDWHWPSLLAVGVVMAVTAAGAETMDAWDARARQADFQYDADIESARLEGESRALLQSLESMAALYDASMEVREDEFETFATHMLSQRRGITRLVWAPFVPDAKCAGFQSVSGITIRPSCAARPTLAPEVVPTRLPPRGHFPTLYRVSLTDALLPLGFDLASDPMLQSAIEHAVTTGESAATPLLARTDEDEGGRFINLIWPVYAHGPRPDSPPTRIAQVHGVVVMTVLVERLVRESFGNLDPRHLLIELADVTDATPSCLFVNTSLERQGFGLHRQAAETAGMSYRRRVLIAGRTWEVHCAAGRRHRTMRPAWQPWLLLCAGFLCAGLLGGLLVQGRLRTARVQRIVEQRTEELRRSNAALLQENLDRQRATEAAQAAARARTEFLANMSHEIRTPMNAILGLTDVVLDSAALAADHREQLRLVQTSATSLLGLINDALDYSKIESGKLVLEPGDFSLGECVGDVVESLRPSAERKHLLLSCGIGEDVPNLVRGDAHRLRQVLINLIGNAVKFTRQGEISVRITRQAEAEDGTTLRFEVIDTGIGIPAHKLESIFEPFVQVDSSTTRAFDGTGLGLAISRQIVNRMGGRLWVESTEGRGSSFFFTAHFGRGRRPSAPPSPPAPAHLGVDAPRRPDGRAIRLLLVEDNAVNRELFSLILRRVGYEIVVAENGRLAVARWAEEAPGAILMDLQMPELDGLSATREIRAREQLTGAHVPIIALTAHARKEDQDACLAAGMDAYLAKPIRPGELLAALARILSPKPPADSTPPPVVAAGPSTWQLEDSLAQLGGDLDLLRELARTFVQRLPVLLQEIDDAIAAGDAGVLRQAAHKLKGSLTPFSTHDAVDAAIRLNAAARIPDFAAVRLARADFERAWRPLCAAVTRAGAAPALSVDDGGISNL